MKIPENPYRKAMANLYIERHMGKPEEEQIKQSVNGKDGEVRSIDYYIAAERFLSQATKALMTVKVKKGDEAFGACEAFSMMQTYVSYEIERLSAMKDAD